MRSHNVFSKVAAMPRMSWSPQNLFNLIARSQHFLKQAQLDFSKSEVQTIYQQRYLAKRFLRAYHGDHVPEKRFKRWFLPTDVPSFATGRPSGDAADSARAGRGGGLFDSILKGESGSAGQGPSASTPTTMPRLPVSSLMVREVERRLDTVVFRSCFARSVYEARAMVLAGKVTLNGEKTLDPGRLLEPGDLFTLEAASIPMLAPEMTKQFAEKAAGDAVTEGEREAAKEEAVSEAEGEGEDAAVETQAQAAAEETPAAQTAAPGSEEAVAEPPSTEAETSVDADAAETTETATTTEEAETDAKTDAKPSQRRQPQPKPEKRQLSPGEFKFVLPPFAAPFLFVPPHLEVSYTTCSTIYLRHPTLSHLKFTQVDPVTGDLKTNTAIRSDIATPFNVQGEMFNLAWEYYTKNSPRVRGDLRRLKLEAKEGRNGIETARARDEWKRKVAQRRGWLKTSSMYTHAAYASRRRRGTRTRKVYGHKVGHHFLGAKMVSSRKGLKGAL